MFDSNECFTWNIWQSFFLGNFIDEGEMFVAEKMMGKSHYSMFMSRMNDRLNCEWDEGGFEKKNI